MTSFIKDCMTCNTVVKETLSASKNSEITLSIMAANDDYLCYKWTTLAKEKNIPFIF